MQYRPLLLIIVCVGLGLLVWQDNRDFIVSLLGTGGSEPRQTMATVPGSANVKSPTAEAPGPETASVPDLSLLSGNPLASFDKESLTNWVLRPLFAPARSRPPPAEQKVSSAPPPPPPDYQLVGVMLNPARTIALLRSKETGIEFHVEVGDMLKGWLVADVGKDSVRLQRDDQTSQIIRFKKSCADASNCP